MQRSRGFSRLAHSRRTCAPTSARFTIRRPNNTFFLTLSRSFYVCTYMCRCVSIFLTLYHLSISSVCVSVCLSLSICQVHIQYTQILSLSLSLSHSHSLSLFRSLFLSLSLSLSLTMGAPPVCGNLQRLTVRVGRNSTRA